MQIRRTLSYTIGLALLSLTALSCAPDLDTHRNFAPDADADRSAGVVIYEEVCQRVAHNDHPTDITGARGLDVCRRGIEPDAATSPRLTALHKQRSHLISALNTVIAPDMVQDAKTLLQDMLPLFDRGVMRQQAESVAALSQQWAQDVAALAALQRIAGRDGYSPRSTSLALVRATLQYPDIDALSGGLLNVLGNDNPVGAWPALQSSLSAQLAHAPGQLLMSDTVSYAVWRDFLLAKEPHVTRAQAPSYVVRRDLRGIAVAARVQGAFVGPFFDADGDGLADVNASGQFVDASGDVLRVPTPFGSRRDGARRDVHGRPVNAANLLLYEYIDAAHTTLAGIVEQGRALLQNHPEAALQWAPVVKAALGPTDKQDHVFADGATLTFDGTSDATSPLLDLSHALAYLTNQEVAPEALDLVQRLWTHHEEPLARGVDLGWQIHDWLQEPALSGAALEPNNSLLDDLLTVATDIVREPGLLKDILAAMRDPLSLQLANRFAEQMRYKDRIDYNLADINAPADGDFVTPVDRTQPDDFENRSVLQRMLHMVHDTAGLQLCNQAYYEFAPCQLFKIDNAALFYLQSMMGTAQLRLTFGDDEVLAAAFSTSLPDGHSAMEWYTGIDGFAFVEGTTNAPAYAVYSVTPQAAARLLFAVYDERVPPDAPYAEGLGRTRDLMARTRLDGKPLDQLHAGTLFAWEKNGMFEQLQPLLNAFAAHHREDLLLKVMDVLHLHWGSKHGFTTRNDDATLQDFSHKTGLVHFEDLLARALTQGRALDVLAELGDVTKSVTVPASLTRSKPLAVERNGEDVMIDLARQLLLPEANFDAHFRDGQVTMLQNDGATKVKRIAVAHLFLKPLRHLDTLLTGQQQGRDFLENLAHTMLAVQHQDGHSTFANRQAYALSTSWLNFAQQRFAAARTERRVKAWSHSFVTDLRAALTHPLFIGAVNLSAALADDAQASAASASYVQYMVSNHIDALQATAVDALQLAANTDAALPLLRAVAPAFEPSMGAVTHAVRLLQESRAQDVRHVTPKLLNNLGKNVSFDQHTGTQSALQLFADAFLTVNRTTPGATASLVSPDYALIFTTLHDFLLDQDNGFERLCTLVETRNAVR